MLCRDFEIIVCDLADNRLMEAGTRERALRHITECARCAARLNAERALTQGLQALGKQDENEKAPAHLKVALRAAFDRQAELAAPILTVAPAPAAPVSGWRASNWLRWSLAAAAMIVVVTAIAFLLGAPAPNSNDMSGPARPEPETTPAVNEQPAPQGIEQKNKTQKHVAALTNGVRQHVKPRALRPSAAQDLASNHETVTDYFPLTYLADATAVEGGIVVRVELSRSALIAMGLPVGMERSETRVKADLVVGDDGVARAVRFVR